ncbi:MAG: transcription termination factor Rho, partial [Deltaproteobacteria bacterium]|nr:transcription termination factor Rho [Deltaproteobacteria bacterium]
SRQLAGLRRRLADQRPADAMEALLKLIERYPDNAELLKNPG